MRLIGRLEAIALSEPKKAPDCVELLDKLRPHLHLAHATGIGRPTGPGSSAHKPGNWV